VGNRTPQHGLDRARDALRLGYDLAPREAQGGVAGRGQELVAAAVGLERPAGAVRAAVGFDDELGRGPSR
jgi:hypothetical protein